MKTFKFLAYCTFGVASILGLTSCEDYLDKSPDTDVSSESAFQNFHNFQGFIEEIYNCIPNKESCNWCTTFNWGEDEILNTGLGDGHLTRQFDLGNYKQWYQNNQSWLWHPANDPFNGGLGDAAVSEPASTNKYHHSLDGHAWYCIRKCNLGLENLDKFAGTKEEKALIEGQLYFFRGWWHEEMMAFFGGLPYLEKALNATEFDRPRMSYRECADLAAADFKKAAELLPMNWDDTKVGGAQKNKNNNRVNRQTALAYLGKVLLYAASPLYEAGAQVGASSNGNTYKYNEEYAKKAAEAFGELLTLVDKGESQYKLHEFATVYYEGEKASIYNHTNSADKTPMDCYSSIFYTIGQGWRQPGGTEAIMRGPGTPENGSNWNFSKLWMTKAGGVIDHDALIHMPTANYVDYAYGMANGQPAFVVKNGELVPNIEGGFDPSHPFKDRDPRFYHDIIFDGFKVFKSDVKDTDTRKPYEYCEMYTGGNLRLDPSMASRTGYYTQKLVPHTVNMIDDSQGWGSALSCYVSYMRLAEVYLMYAEACAATGGATAKSSNCSLTAEDAINVLRDRVGAGHVSYTDAKGFMDEVRRERACELAFEGHRWNDLQRWLLLTEAPYNIKQSAEFSRKLDDKSWYVNNDPADAEVVGYEHKTILTRPYDAKHYFLPFKEGDVYLYKEFEQNPGW